MSLIYCNEDRKMWFVCHICGWEGYITYGELKCLYCGR